jgi:hypothetical protein
VGSRGTLRQTMRDFVLGTTAVRVSMTLSSRESIIGALKEGVNAWGNLSLWLSPSPSPSTEREIDAEVLVDFVGTWNRLWGSFKRRRWR